MDRVLVVVVVVVREDLASNFRDNLINLMPVLVGRGQLVVKEVNGAKLTGKDLGQYFQVCRIRTDVSPICLTQYTFLANSATVCMRCRSYIETTLRSLGCK